MQSKAKGLRQLHEASVDFQNVPKLEREVWAFFLEGAMNLKVVAFLSQGQWTVN